MTPHSSKKRLDVIVVGAGLSGLSAAKTLEAAGCTCQVLEAQDRAGGRIRSTVSRDGYVMEAGAQFLNQDMGNLIGLVRGAGLDPVATAAGEASVALDVSGSIDAAPWLARLEDDWPRLLALAGVASGRADQTVSQLIRHVTTDSMGVRVMESSLCELLCRSPSTISAQGLLALYEKYPSERPDGELQVSGPLSAVIDRLTADLHSPLVYNAPVTEVVENGNGAQVHTPQGTFRAKHVVLAVTPVAARAIRLPSAVHASADAALGSYEPGALVKISLIYRDAFWHELAGPDGRHSIRAIVSLDPGGIAAVDASRAGEGIGRLVVFAGGPHGQALARANESQRREVAVNLLSRALGNAAARPLSVTYGVWVHGSWCGGGYNSYISYGGMPDAAAQLRAIRGTVVFACSEIAERFPGYMEGALSAGRAAATSVIRELGRA
jgi:monoamine oxidase